MTFTVCGQMNSSPSLTDQKLFFRDPSDGTEDDDPEGFVPDPHCLDFVDIDQAFLEGDSADEDDELPAWAYLSDKELDRLVCAHQLSIVRALGLTPEEWIPPQDFILECIEDATSVDEMVEIARLLYRDCLSGEVECPPDNVEPPAAVTDEQIPVAQCSCHREPIKPNAEQCTCRVWRNSTTTTLKRGLRHEKKLNNGDVRHWTDKVMKVVHHHSHGVHGKKKIKPRSFGNSVEMC